MAIPKARVRISRPDVLQGKTYKITPAIMDEADYITVNAGLSDEELRPVAIFINSKDMRNFEWVSAMTRLISAQFQQPGPFPKFVIEEMKDSHDANGGYFLQGGGGKVASVVAHVGLILEKHCKELKLI